METQDAKATLKSLLEGVDPVTGGPIDQGLALHHPSVIRALECALTVMAAEQARIKRRARLPRNTGRPWRPADDQQLLAAFRAGMRLEQAAADLQRSLASVESRLEWLGALTPEQRVTRNRYVTANRAAGGIAG